MAVSEIDEQLLERCLARSPNAWEDFVDRFLGLVLHVVNHTARARSIQLTEQDREDVAAEVFVRIVHQDFAVLRNFRRESSLSTYLTVIARRVVVHEFLNRKLPAATVQQLAAHHDVELANSNAADTLSNREEVERLIGTLSGPEAEIIRLHYLDGKSYQEISSKTGIPSNSIGPTLSRARSKMRLASSGSSSTTSNP